MAGTIEGTLRHALFLARHLNKCDPKYVVVAVLLELGVAPNRAGFDCLKKAILLRFENPMQMITKDVYPAVGSSYSHQLSADQVEQMIRSAITKAWKSRDEEVWGLYFSPDQNGRIRKPSNADFISMIARFVELWQGCCEGVSYEKV